MQEILGRIWRLIDENSGEYAEKLMNIRKMLFIFQTNKKKLKNLYETQENCEKIFFMKTFNRREFYIWQKIEYLLIQLVETDSGYTCWSVCKNEST